MRPVVLALALPACAVVTKGPEPTEPTSTSTSTSTTTSTSAASVERPGGAWRTEQMSCGAEADHCLREGTWLAVMPNGYKRVHPVFAVGDAWYDWDSLGQVEVVEAYRTRPATVDDLVEGATVVFAERVPQYESEAYHDWRVETVHSVDAAAGSFEFGSGSADMPVAAARVIVETR